MSHNGGTMLQTKAPINEEDIQWIIDRFINLLCLYHWRIKYKVVDDSKLGRSLMQVVPDRDRNIATIYIRDSLVGLPTAEFAPLLLHELMHLVLDPIVEEHTVQMQYETSNEQLAEYEKRFRSRLEKVIEHLTWQISPLIHFTDDLALAKTTILSHAQVIEALRRDNDCLKDLCIENKVALDQIRELLQGVLNKEQQMMDLTDAFPAVSKTEVQSSK